MMECAELGLPGCYELRPKVLADARGHFVKTYHEERFRELGLRTDWREEYFTTSRGGVVRGMHFQSPPCQHAKLVTCVAGEALDVALDLRPGPSYGRVVSRPLSSRTPSLLYLPEGIAHGFLARAEGTILHYKVTSVYAPDHDLGILWSSIPFDWPASSPVVSARDAAFPPLDGFKTPFWS